jgi:hypothetical protein
MARHFHLTNCTVDAEPGEIETQIIRIAADEVVLNLSS